MSSSFVVFSVTLGGWYISAVFPRCWLKSGAGVNCGEPRAALLEAAASSLRVYLSTTGAVLSLNSHE